MSESTLPWMKPCEHAEPQGASQLHGVCIFCYRDRLSDAHRQIASTDNHTQPTSRREWYQNGYDDGAKEVNENLSGRIVELEAERDEARAQAAAMRKFITDDFVHLNYGIEELGDLVMSKCAICGMEGPRGVEPLHGDACPLFFGAGRALVHEYKPVGIFDVIEVQHGRAAREQAEQEARAYVEAHTGNELAAWRTEASLCRDEHGALVEELAAVRERLVHAQQEREEAGDAQARLQDERNRLARTVDRKDEQMAELQEALEKANKERDEAIARGKETARKWNAREKELGEEALRHGRQLHEARAERDQWRANFYTVADAVAPESSSIERLAGVARETRQRADAAEAALRKIMDALSDGERDKPLRLQAAYQCARAALTSPATATISVVPGDPETSDRVSRLVEAAMKWRCKTCGLPSLVTCGMCGDEAIPVSDSLDSHTGEKK